MTDKRGPSPCNNNTEKIRRCRFQPGLADCSSGQVTCSQLPWLSLSSSWPSESDGLDGFLNRVLGGSGEFPDLTLILA